MIDGKAYNAAVKKARELEVVSENEIAEIEKEIVLDDELMDDDCNTHEGDK